MDSDSDLLNDAAARDAARRTAKSEGAFRTISEVSTDLGVPQHVLRFWETKFTQVRPMKRGGGRRYYRPEDVRLLEAIRDLLYNDGYTIRGAQKLLRENGLRAVLSQTAGPDTEADERVPESAKPGDTPEEGVFIAFTPKMEQEDTAEDAILPLSASSIASETENRPALRTFDLELMREPPGFATLPATPPLTLMPAASSAIPTVAEAPAPTPFTVPADPATPVAVEHGQSVVHPAPIADTSEVSQTSATTPSVSAFLEETQRVELDETLRELEDLRRILRQAGL